MSIPRWPTSGKAQQAEALNIAPTSLKGIGNLGFSPKLLSSLKLPWMCLEELLLGVLGSLAEGQPLLKLPPSVSSGPRGARGYSEACCSQEVDTSGYLRTRPETK